MKPGWSPVRPSQASARVMRRGAGGVGAVTTRGVAGGDATAIGAAVDMGKTAEPYWAPLFDGYQHSKAWIAEHTPDAIVLVYNDHATSFSLDLIPTFAIGTGPSYPVADEG